MSSLEAIRKASNKIAKEYQRGWGSVILQQIIERGIRDIKNDHETDLFNIDQEVVQQVIEILGSYDITDNNL